MAKRNPEICPYCGHVILDDDQEYCDYCGKDIEKEDPDNKKSSGSCLGSTVTLLFIIFLIILLVTKT